MDYNVDWFDPSQGSIVIFTGAGMSTTAGIPDFRGPGGLELPGNRPPLVMMGAAEKDLEWRNPTFAHRAITLAVDRGWVSLVVTSNHDGLHQRAGLAGDKVVDMFGCVFIERCLVCSKRFFRSVVVPHLGRKCEHCGAKLKRTGVNMGDITPADLIEKADQAASGASLVLVLGSSLTVSPFCDLVTKGNKLVIVNQHEDTPFDKHAHKVVRSTCDHVMAAILQKMQVDRVPPLVINRDWQICWERTDNKRELVIKGVQPNEPPVALVEVEIHHGGRKSFLDPATTGLFSLRFEVTELKVLATLHPKVGVADPVEVSVVAEGVTGSQDCVCRTSLPALVVKDAIG
eukprot:TRINITY_DN112730_c0_g1_i1.p1 TRINITY_DN112730_c0_g1~~TRINITY_DN112730_c0_g1_i1.p1  ORF type:complete len:344 (+),score=40.03 TRINITY_DN112730_c0_g1_i1:50-1081(+)